VEIDCPVDCPFLGAEGSMLLADRQSSDAPLPTGEEISDFVAELMDAGPRGNFMAAAEPTAVTALNRLIEFADAEDTTIQGAIWEWLVFGAQDVQGQALLDRIIARLPRALTVSERAALRALHASRYGLFTIESFPSPDTVQVRDLLADEPLELYNDAIAERHHVGQTLACFVTRTQSGVEVVSGAWQLPKGVEESFPLRLREICDESPLKGIPLPEFVTRVAIVLPLLMFEHFGAEESGDAGFPPPSF